MKVTVMKQVVVGMGMNTAMVMTRPTAAKIASRFFMVILVTECGQPSCPARGNRNRSPQGTTGQGPLERNQVTHGDLPETLERSQTGNFCGLGSVNLQVYPHGPTNPS